MTLTRSALILALLLPACRSPTEVLDFAQLEGGWELTLQQDLGCAPPAPARVIPFTVRTSVTALGVNRIVGEWDRPTLGIFFHLNGSFDAETREVWISFDFRSGTDGPLQQVFELEAAVTRIDRMSGTLLPGTTPFYDIGHCSQVATARKVD